MWGTWTGGSATVVSFGYGAYTTPPTGPRSYLPWTTGDLRTTLLASLGTVTFILIGGITDSTARLNSASPTADIVSRQESVNFNVTNLQYQNTVVGTGSSGISCTSGRLAARVSAVTCTDRCSATSLSVWGSFTGFFATPNAEGAGLTFVMGGVGTDQGVNGTEAFKR